MLFARVDGWISTLALFPSLSLCFCLVFPHPKGSIFISFPDGTGMLYSLQGTTEPPKAEDTIVHKVPAKTHHSQLLTVHNWLTEQQR